MSANPIPWNVVAVSGTHTAAPNEISLCTAGAGGFVLTLPAVNIGAAVFAKKVDSGAGTVTLTPASGTIDGAANKPLTVQYDAYHLVSDGTNRPYRCKVRAPSFSNLSALPHMVRGELIADVVAVIGSIDIVLGDVDR